MPRCRRQGVLLEAGPFPLRALLALGRVDRGEVELLEPPNHTTTTAGRTGGPPPLWLALDQVVDPQNFGAILRSAYFFGVDGVAVCARNSAPCSPAVSRASAGALELMTIHAVNNVMRFLTVGGARARTRCPPQAPPCLSARASRTHAGERRQRLDRPGHERGEPGGGGQPSVPLRRADHPRAGSVPLRASQLQQPQRRRRRRRRSHPLPATGNEGHGLRENVERLCQTLLQIESASDRSVVDSLNVSVAAALLCSQWRHAAGAPPAPS
jgi:hypothetical protein